MSITGFRHSRQIFAHLWVTLTLGVVLPVAEAKALDAPRLRARKTSESVVKIVAEAAEAARRRPRLQLQRASAQDKFKTVRMVRLTRRHRVLFDKTFEVGRYRYRSRLLWRRNRSGWSNTVRVAVEPTEMSEPVASPTPMPIETPNPEPTIAPDPNAAAECPDGSEEELLAQVNRYRAEADLPALQVDARLASAALTHVYAMIVMQDLTHTGWFNEILATGYDGTHMSQNIASHYTDAEELAAGFMNSPLHRANILNTEDLVTGVACAIDSHGVYWWAQNFGN